VNSLPDRSDLGSYPVADFSVSGAERLDSIIIELIS
jgi:hypothetical protein